MYGIAFYDGLKVDDLIYFRTLHSLCFRALGLEKESIFNASFTRKFNRLGFYKLTTNKDESRRMTKDDKMLVIYDRERSGNIVPKDVDLSYYSAFKKVYEDFKRLYGLVDFYDCLIRFKKRGDFIPGIKVVFIDEAQDLTKLQWDVCRIAFAGAEHIRIAGDDKQCLFEYAGADPKILIGLSKRYKTVKISETYRLTDVNCRQANVIANSVLVNKVENVSVPVKGDTGFVESIYSLDDLCQKIAGDIERNGCLPSRWYLLFRNNYFIHGVTKVLQKHLIPYHTNKSFFIGSRDLVHIKRYFAFRKIGFNCKTYGFDAFCEKYGISDINKSFTESNLVSGEERYIYEEYVNKYGIENLDVMAKSVPSVLLTTVHRVKGDEADFAALFLSCTKQVARTLNSGVRGADSEGRVMYVAKTRAKIGTYHVFMRNKFNLGKIIDAVEDIA